MTPPEKLDRYVKLVTIVLDAASEEGERANAQASMARMRKEHPDIHDEAMHQYVSGRTGPGSAKPPGGARPFFRDFLTKAAEQVDWSMLLGSAAKQMFNMATGPIGDDLLRFASKKQFESLDMLGRRMVDAGALELYQLPLLEQQAKLLADRGLVTLERGPLGGVLMIRKRRRKERG